MRLRRWFIDKRHVLLFCWIWLQSEANAATSRCDDHPGCRDKLSQGFQYEQQHNFGNALRMFQECFALAPEPRIAFNVGRMWQRLGEFSEAILWYDKAGTEAGNDAELTRRIMEARSELPRLENRLPTEPFKVPTGTFLPAKAAQTSTLSQNRRPDSGLIIQTNNESKNRNTNTNIITINLPGIPPTTAAVPAMADAPQRKSPLYKHWLPWTLLSAGLGGGVAVLLAVFTQPQTRSGIRVETGLEARNGAMP